MSATQEHTVSANRPARPAHAAPAASNGAVVPVETVSIEIAGIEVALPVKFHTGHVLTDAQAKVLDAAYRRQFTNNHSAMAAARKVQFNKAVDDAGRANYPTWTAAQYQAAYTDYEPTIGGRTGGLENLRNDAAWRVFLSMVVDHNKDVANGGQGLLKGGAVGKPFNVPSGKGSAEFREKMAGNVLRSDKYSTAVQTQVDLLLAERAAKKTDKAAKVDLGTIDVDSIL